MRTYDDFVASTGENSSYTGRLDPEYREYDDDPEPLSAEEAAIVRADEDEGKWREKD